MASKADGKDWKIFIDLLKKYSQTDQIKVGHLIVNKGTEGHWGQECKAKLKEGGGVGFNSKSKSVEPKTKNIHLYKNEKWGKE